MCLNEADLTTMGQSTITASLAQAHHGRGIRLCLGLVQVRLHQGRKGHIWFIEPAETVLWSVPELDSEWAAEPNGFSAKCGEEARSTRGVVDIHLNLVLAAITLELRLHKNLPTIVGIAPVKVIADSIKMSQPV